MISTPKYCMGVGKGERRAIYIYAPTNSSKAGRGELSLLLGNMLELWKVHKISHLSNLNYSPIYSVTLVKKILFLPKSWKSITEKNWILGYNSFGNAINSVPLWRGFWLTFPAICALFSASTPLWWCLCLFPHLVQPSPAATLSWSVEVPENFRVSETHTHFKQLTVRNCLIRAAANIITWWGRTPRTSYPMFGKVSFKLWSSTVRQQYTVN